MVLPRHPLYGREVVVLKRWRVWHVPSAQTVSTRQFVELIAAQAGYRVGIRRTPNWIVRALRVVNPTVRAVSEQLYQSERPSVVDHGKICPRI